jgi:hypothetical protein
MLIHTLLALTLTTASAPAPDAASTVTFKFENPQLQPASYIIEIHEDGSGHYKSVPGTPSPDSYSTDGIVSKVQDRDIKVSDRLRAKLFSTARTHHYFATDCEAAKLHVAFTGKKTLTYSGPDGAGACTYNYSQDDELNYLADEMQALSFTLEEGQRISLQLQHSRLALDAELETLQDAAKNGRAVELANISSQLQAVVEDDAVLERARKRARLLLAGN